jgi:thiol-disulfide isomerase/thioredoxin
MNVPVKRLLLLPALLIALSACGTKPDFETLDGDSGRFSDYRGRWVLVNYWAEWCKPCIAEMPELKKFSDAHAAQAVVLTVNFDGAAGDVLREQVRKLNIEVPVLVNDPAALLGIERPQGLPTTFVFDPQGKLAATLAGEQTAASLAAAIQTSASPSAAGP